MKTRGQKISALIGLTIFVLVILSLLNRCAAQTYVLTQVSTHESKPEWKKALGHITITAEENVIEVFCNNERSSYVITRTDKDKGRVVYTLLGFKWAVMIVQSYTREVNNKTVETGTITFDKANGLLTQYRFKNIRL